MKQNPFRRRGYFEKLGSLHSGSNPFAKTLNQPQTTKVGEMGFLEGKTNFSGTFWRLAQNTLLGKFLPQHLFDPYCSIFSLITYCFPCFHGIIILFFTQPAVLAGTAHSTTG